MSSMFASLFSLALLGAIAGLIGETVGALQRNLLVRKALYASAFFFISISTLLLLITSPEVGMVILTIFGGFRLLNAGRVLKGRMNEEHAYEVTRRTSLGLILSQFVVVCAWILSSYFRLSDVLLLYGMVMAGFALVLLVSAERTLRHSRLRLAEKNLTLKECPTVSVCIPARNETSDLAACLRTVLDSTYPKIEVLVLDDCSQAKTSEIIRKFAHDGARFIKGDPPREGWLAKNQAYETLAEAANGELLLFCGVDVRFDPEAIGRLVRLKLARHKKMLSVMPMRADTKVSAGFIQPARYWWEIALPRRWFNRPPVLSTTWLIEAKTLRKLGGFKAVDNTIVPEAHLARELVKTDEYSFVTANEELEITSVKDAAEQKATAIRVRYPQLRKRPETVAWVFLLELGLLFMPFVLVVAGFFADLGALWLLSIAAAFLLESAHGLIIRTWNPHSWLIGGLPGSIVADCCLLIISMWQYEFATVTWKDRNICIPVMHVIPQLPQLKD